MKEQERVEFKEVLLERRRTLLGDFKNMASEALDRNGQGNQSNKWSENFAEFGTDNFEQEMTLNLMQGEQEEIKAIDEALERLEQGTYGMCDTCGKRIPKARLRAVPHAKLCIDCKRQEELAAGR